MSSYSGDAAEQVVHMSLEGAEVAVKLAGSGAKQLAILLYAVLKDQKKTSGKIRLTNLLRSGKELKVFAVQDQDLQKFCSEAKKYGVLYTVLKDRDANDGLTDIMVRAEDASKINRIVERFKLATVDTASIKHDIEKTRQEKESAPAAPKQAVPQKDAEDILLDDMMGAPIQKEPPSPENPTAAKTEKSPPSAPTSGMQRKTAEGTAKESRPSVREKLREIKAARQEKTEIPKQQEAARSSKQPLPTMNMHQNPGKKKPKVKAR